MQLTGADVDLHVVENPKNFSIAGFAKLTRIGNLVIIALAQYMTTAFLIADSTQLTSYLLSPRLFILSLSSVLIAASGYIINDYYDVKIDFLNKPERVVVGKVIKRRVVMVAHTLINFTGIALGYLVLPIVALVNFLSAVTLWWYSNRLKRLPLIGNLAVGLLTGLSIYIVELVFQSGNKLVIIYAAFAFGYTVIREIVKDLEDVKGDEAFGCRTLPVVFGIQKTKNIIYAIMMIIAAALSWTLNQEWSSFNNMLTIGNLVMLIMLTIFLHRADTVKHFHQLSSLTKLMMLIGVFSMILS